jgi:hypothetical protein
VNFFRFCSKAKNSFHKAYGSGFSWGAAVILVGYGIAEYVDQRLTKKSREALFDDVLFKWKPTKDDSEPD